MTKISKEVAIEEVNKWLDYKKIKEKKRIAFKEAIESLVEAVCDGCLVLKEDFTFTQMLEFPVGANKEFKSLDYRPRIDVSTIQKYANGATTGDARILATLAALSGQAKEVIAKMDTEDYSVASSIAIFFL